MTRRHTAAVLAAALLAGCASAPEKRWYKNGATEAVFNMDTARCRMQLAAIPGPAEVRGNGTGNGLSNAGVALQDAATRVQFMQDCMVAQGWTLR